MQTTATPVPTSAASATIHHLTPKAAHAAEPTPKPASFFLLDEMARGSGAVAIDRRARPPRSADARAPPSALQILVEPAGAALPGVVRVGLVVGRAIVRVEAVTRLGIDHDLDGLVAVLLAHLAPLLRVLVLRVLVLAAVETEERDLDVRGEIEAGDRAVRAL